MGEQKSIPRGKVGRAARFVRTGAKLGGNYVRHWAKSSFDKDYDPSNYDRENAEDIYDVLSQLKGSALKVAQMLSMDKNLLPTAYAEKFRMAQYQAPALSYPLVVRTFKKSLGKEPLELYDDFTKKAVKAASIGQVHQATLNGEKLAVKIQYPGVAESVSSDLRLVKPVAMRLLNVKSKDLEQYMVEVEDRLLEETDYSLELKRAMEIIDACKGLDNIVFPKYYPGLSSDRVLTMQWVEGEHLTDWINSNPSQEHRNKIGQALWDFYQYQMHSLGRVHADPHPGNFLVTSDEKLVVLDFGCVKEIPEDFQKKYFEFMSFEVLQNKDRFVQLLKEFQFILPGDDMELRLFLVKTYEQMVRLLCLPFNSEYFDFGDNEFLERIFAFGDEMSQNKLLRSGGTARGSRHGIYVNRTFFGLYTILNDIGARVNTQRYIPKFEQKAS